MGAPTGKTISGPVAIVAGQGGLPQRLVAHMEVSGATFLIVTFQSEPLNWLGTREVLSARIEHLGALFDGLRAANCAQVVFAGRFDRPTLVPAEFDEKFRQMAPLLLPAMAGGDGGTLVAITTLFEGEGLQILGAHDVDPDLLAAAGTPTVAKPGDGDAKDAARAAEITTAMGSVDVGQAAVVANGVCLGVESIQGTDSLLDYVAAGRSTSPAPSGVLYKAPRPQQDLRIDMPSIGPETMVTAAKAGLAGVVIEAGRALVLDKVATIQAADRLGLFLWVRSAPAATSETPTSV